MKRNSILLVLVLSLISCATPSRLRTQMNSQLFDSLSLGDDVRMIHGKLGKPHSVLQGRSDEEFWIYDDATGGQIASIGISKADGRVRSIMVIPTIGEPDQQNPEVLKNRLSNGGYESAPIQRCERDYTPPEVYFVDPTKGVAVAVNRNTNEVESYTRMLPIEARELLEAIKNCKM